MNEVKNSKRNIGIELLKIISMFMVVLLHCLNMGGTISGAKTLSLNYDLAILLDSMAYVAVDVFALITGFVSIKSRNRYTHNWNRILDIWFPTVFYCVLITAIHYTKQYIETGKSVTFEIISHNIFPLAGSIYWYLGAYVFVWLLSPYINKMLHSLSKKQNLTLVIIILSVLSLYSLVYVNLDADPFRTGGGYSPLWILVLYITGAYISLYYDDFKKISKYVYLIIYFVCTFAACAIKILSNYMPTAKERKHIGSMALSYTSPFMVMASIGLLLAFAAFEIKRCRKLIVTGASVSFFVYIIHFHPACRLLLTDLFKPIANERWYVMLAAVIGGALAIYIACSLIDYVRQRLFAALHINVLYDKTVKLCSRMYNIVISKAVK